MKSVLTVCIGYAFGWVACATADEIFNASASIENQGPPFMSIPAFDFQQNPAIAGDPVLPGNISAVVHSDEMLGDGSSFVGDASATVDRTTPAAGAPPILRATASGSITDTSSGKFRSLHRVSSSASWTLNLVATGPGPEFFMVPTFRLTGTITGTGSALEGGTGIRLQHEFQTATYPAFAMVPTSGATTIVNQTVSSPPIMLQSASINRVQISLENTLDLIGNAGVLSPYSASADANFGSSLELVSIQFFSDAGLTDDISSAITLSGGGPTDLQALVVPEPATWVLVIFAGLAITLWTRRR